MWFYDRNGMPLAFCDDGEHIFLVCGKPAGYIYDGAVYRFNGQQIGWFENGWIRDMRGYAVFFTDNADTYGPVKPTKKVIPVKGVRSIIPIKGVRQVRQVRPVKSFSWSGIAGEEFF